MLAMTPGSVVQMDMQAKVSAASAADGLVDPTKFKKLSYTDIIKHVGVITKYSPDVVLPANIARNITRKYAEHLLDKENWSAWVDTTRCWGDGTDGGWDMANPRLVDLPPDRLPEDENQFAEQLYGCFFNDVGLRMVTNVSSLVNGAVNSLVSFAHTFLEAYETKWLADTAELGDLECLQNMLHVFRGISAILCPEPGLHSATAADADFFAMTEKDKKTKKRMDVLLQPASRVMLNHITSCPTWRSHVVAYIKVGALELEHTPILRSLMDKLSIVHQQDWGTKVDIYEEVCNYLPRILEDLRPGAGDKLQARLVAILAGEAASIQGGEAEWKDSQLANKLLALQRLSKFLQTPAIKCDATQGLLQSINEKIDEWRTANHKSALEHCAMSALNDQTHVIALNDVLDASQGMSIEPQLGVHLADLRDLLLKLMHKDVTALTPSECNAAALGAHRAAWGKLSAIPAVVDAKGGPAADGVVQSAEPERSSKRSSP